jgi:transcriptional regulator with XRE-family HTH domain
MARKTKDDDVAHLPRKYEPGMPKSLRMQEVVADFGYNLRKERQNRGFTMEETVNMMSISESYLGLLERGKRTPSLECMFGFCDTFGITPNDLLLSRNKDKKELKVSESSADRQSDRFNAALSLLRSLNETELECVVNIMLDIQKMQKSIKSGKVSSD